MNIDKVALASSKASLKVISSAGGSITAPAATSVNSPQSNIVTIPHNQGNTDVLFSVIADATNVYGSTRYVTAPWSTPDGRISIDAYIDVDNLYIKATSSTAGSPQAATSFTYYYNIIIP